MSRSTIIGDLGFAHRIATCFYIKSYVMKRQNNIVNSIYYYPYNPDDQTSLVVSSSYLSPRYAGKQLQLAILPSKRRGVARQLAQLIPKYCQPISVKSLERRSSFRRGELSKLILNLSTFIP